MPRVFAYDVFLSHSSKDKPIIRELAERLRADGVRVWLDDWEIQPGDSIPSKIEQGLEQSRVLILAMSANAFASEWVKLERHTAMFRDPENAERRFIPVRLDDAPAPDILRQFMYIDWRQASDREYARLASICQSSSTPTAPARVHNELQTRMTPSAPILLKTVKLGHAASVRSVVVSDDSRFALSSSYDAVVRLWDVRTRRAVMFFEGHAGYVWGVALSRDNRLAASGSDDNSARVWNVEAGCTLAVLLGHKSGVLCVALTDDGTRILTGSRDHTVRLWDIETARTICELKGHNGYVSSVAISRDGRRAVSGSEDGTARIWDIESGGLLATLQGHTGCVTSVAISSGRQRVITGSYDKTVRVWEGETGRCLAVLEGHTESVTTVAFSSDGRLALSGSEDHTVRVWDAENGRNLAVLEGHTATIRWVSFEHSGVQIHSVAGNSLLYVWELPINRTADREAIYTNAKVMLVGDSGVGKTGLAQRLATGAFKESISTDAHWATQLPLRHGSSAEGVDREIWLWDFAGQADYRLLHRLFMDESALALLVFNPQDANPFDGLGEWDHGIRRAAGHDLKKLLVAGRCDRGGLIVSRHSLDQFARERIFACYLETSAVTGAGCEELKQEIVNHIDWDRIPHTSSPRIFKLLKDAILALRDAGRVLLRIVELKQLLETSLPDEPFTVDQLRAVVGLLSGPGLVWKLPFGDFVLLRPDRLHAYASAVIRKVRKHVDEIGVIDEKDIEEGRLDFQDLERLPRDEEDILFRALPQTLIEHGICLSENTPAGALLVFPSYFKRERPDAPDHPARLVTYKFHGPLDEIYATLVVRLHHTPAFDKDQLWRYAADFKTPAGLRVGLKMTKLSEGAADLTLYADPATPDETQATFVRYVYEHLKSKQIEVIRQRHYCCANPKCGEPVRDDRAVAKALAGKRKSIRCQYCDRPIKLLDLIEARFGAEDKRREVQELTAQAVASIDNESREFILVGHAFAIAGEAGQIFRPTANSDWGIDGEIEFKDSNGNASGQRVYLQLKSGDSYLAHRKRDDVEVFTIKNPRHAEYWQQHRYPVMLVIRTSNGAIRWMDVSEYLRREAGRQQGAVKQIVFDGEPFTALNVQRMRDKFIPPPETG